MYEHRYKHGKQKEIMTLEDFKLRIQDADALGCKLSHLAFTIILWHTGVRKSELYERVKSDVKVTDEYLIIDFGKRKKKGAEVPPLKIPLSYYGVKSYVLPYLGVAKGVYTLHRKNKRLFPLIKSASAWYIVKHILGKQYYPHYLRLRKLSAIGKKHGVTHVKAVSGIKSLKALESYIGYDEATQDEAMRDSE